MRPPSRAGAARLPLAFALALVIGLAPFASHAAGLRLTPNAAEQDALGDTDDGKYIRARERAEVLLAEDPDSFVGLWVLAQAHHYEEGNLPRALHLVRRARGLLEAEHGDAPDEGRALGWHRKLLEEEIRLLGEMDANEEQVALLEAHRDRYGSRLERRAIWPLMKLGRLDEAEALARRLALDDDVSVRAGAFNGLLSIADERLDRDATWTLGVEGLAKTQDQSCILLYNASQSALLVLDFDEAERLAKRALDAELDDCGNSAWARLAPVALVQGEFQRAVSALEKLRDRTASFERHRRLQYRKSNRGLLVDLLVATGRLTEALAMARDAFARPDRAGMSSLHPDEHRLAHGVLLSAALEQSLAKTRERMASRGGWGALALMPELVALAAERARVGRELRRMAATDGRLTSLVRPYMRETYPWVVGTLHDLIGRGALTAALDVARRRDLDSRVAKELRGFYDALEGELAWRDGDLESAQTHLSAALRAIPPRARLARLRAQAVLAEVLLARGRHGEARDHLREVLRHWPTAFRLLGTSVPTARTHDGTPVGQAIAARLASSPRLRAPGGGNAPWVVDVTTETLGGEVAAASVCLRDVATGADVACGHVTTDEATQVYPELASETALEVAACDALHEAAFRPRIELTRRDIDTLDGSPMRVDPDRVLDELLTPSGARGGDR